MFKVTNLPVVSSLIYGSKWASNTWVGSRFPLEKITLEADDIDSQKKYFDEAAREKYIKELGDISLSKLRNDLITIDAFFLKMGGKGLDRALGRDPNTQMTITDATGKFYGTVWLKDYLDNIESVLVSIKDIIPRRVDELIDLAGERKPEVLREAMQLAISPSPSNIILEDLIRENQLDNFSARLNSCPADELASLANELIYTGIGMDCSRLQMKNKDFSTRLIWLLPI